MDEIVVEGLSDICGNSISIITQLLGISDVVTDFLFWKSIKNSERIDATAIDAVLAFAIIGAVIEGYYLLIVVYETIRSRLYEKERKANLKRMFLGFGMIKSYICALAEDCPQLILLIVCTFQGDQGWSFEAKLLFWTSIVSVYFKLASGLISVARDEGHDGDQCKLLCLPLWPLCCGCPCFLTVLLMYFLLNKDN